MASTPPPPQAFIAAQVVSLPVFILDCTFFFFLWLLFLLFLSLHKHALLISWEMLLLSWRWWWPSPVSLTTGRTKNVVQGREMKVFPMALLSKPWQRLPGDISPPPVGISVQILPLWQDALNFRSVGHEDKKHKHENIVPRHVFVYCAASKTKLEVFLVAIRCSCLVMFWIGCHVVFHS